MHLPWHDTAPGDGPPISTSVLPAEAAKLAALAAGQYVLEIGSAYGYSAVTMALTGSPVTAVDPHTWIPGSLPAMERNLDAYGVQDRVTIVQQPSADVLAALAGDRQNGPGLVFVDGDHSYEAVRADVTGALKVLRPGGVLACHDYGEDCCCPGVRQALDEIFPGGPDELAGSLFVVKT
jgi:predicted O-methyltransferase YrrM